MKLLKKLERNIVVFFGSLLLSSLFMISLIFILLSKTIESNYISEDIDFFEMESLISDMEDVPKEKILNVLNKKEARLFATINEQAYVHRLIFIAALITLGFAFLFIMLLFFKKSSKSIYSINSLIHEISLGKLGEAHKTNAYKFLGFEDLHDNLQKVLCNLIEYKNYIQKVYNNDFEYKYKRLNNKDEIGNALIELRNKLIKNEQLEAERKVKDRQEKWSTEGIAQFSDILRKNSDNIKQMGDSLMSNLVDYLNVNQGALFVLFKDEFDNIFYELKSAVAYGREKFIESKIQVGEGLVGRCVFEKEYIYLKDIPNNYITITSGLGDAPPNNLLLLPCMFNDEVIAVLELASFGIIELYKINFLEKLAESIASTISNLRATESTLRLLEASKIQSEELAAQEEEMRQNLEEMSATQEELNRQMEANKAMHKTVKENQQLLISVLDHIPGKIFVKDHEHKLILLNNEVANVYKTTVEELLGTSDFDNHTYEDAVKYQANEKEILENGAETYVQEESISGEIRYLKTTKMPFYLPHLKTTGLLGIQSDITDVYLMEQKIEKQNEELTNLKNNLV